MLEDLVCLGSVCVIFFILYVAISVWVYKDAESRGMSGLLWVLVIFLLGWIGLIIYLLVRNPRYPAYNYYPPPPAYQQYPPPPGGYYGQPQGPPPPSKAKDDDILGDPRIREKVCGKCGGTLDESSKFCGFCGAKL